VYVEGIAQVKPGARVGDIGAASRIRRGSGILLRDCRTWCGQALPHGTNTFCERDEVYGSAQEWCSRSSQ